MELLKGKAEIAQGEIKTMAMSLKTMKDRRVGLQKDCDGDSERMQAMLGDLQGLERELSGREAEVQGLDGRRGQLEAENGRVERAREELGDELAGLRLKYKALKDDWTTAKNKLQSLAEQK